MTTMARPDLLRRLNERRVLEVVRTAGGCSRADITRLTGISAPTVSKVVAGLLNAGVLEEYDSPEVRIGRPGRLLRLAMGKAQVLGVTVGVRETRLFAASLDGTVDWASAATFETPGDHPAVLSRLTAEIRAVRRGGRRRTLGLGVSLPALIDETAGAAVYAPRLRWADGRPFAADLARATGLEVALVAESRGLSLAERLFGDARDLTDYLVVDLADGLTMGLVCGGRPVSGRNGLAGGFGHMALDPGGAVCGCGSRGCLETLAGDLARAGVGPAHDRGAGRRGRPQRRPGGPSGVREEPRVAVGGDGRPDQRAQPAGGVPARRPAGSR